MSEYDLSKPGDQRDRPGWVRWWLLPAALAAVLLPLAYASRTRQPAPAPAASLAFSVAEICRGAVVVRVRQLDATPPDADHKEYATFVLAQPTDSGYVVSCTKGGDYRGYLRAGQLARLSMEAG